MQCESAKDLLSDYYEDSIHPALKIPLEAHLRGCAECRIEAEGLRLVWRALDSAPVVEPPVDFRAGVWRRIDAAQRDLRGARRSRPLGDFWRSLWSRPALGWAAAALMIVLLSGVAVPGAFHRAGLGDPLGVWHHTATPQTVTVGAPAVGADGASVSVAVRNDGAGAATITLQAFDGSRMVGSATVSVPSRSSGTYAVTNLAPGTDLQHLRVAAVPSQR